MKLTLENFDEITSYLGYNLIAESNRKIHHLKNDIEHSDVDMIELCETLHTDTQDRLTEAKTMQVIGKALIGLSETLYKNMQENNDLENNQNGDNER